MSAIAVLRRDDGILIACDSISYGIDGIIRSTTANKILAVPELDCAIGNVGVGNFTTILRAYIGAKYRDFDDLLNGIESDFGRALIDMRGAGQAEPDSKCTAFVAGWSNARDRFETYAISATDKQITMNGVVETRPAFKLAPLVGDWCSSAYNRNDSARFGLDRDDMPTVNTAVGYVCACRASSSMSGVGDYDGVPYAVGGHIQVMHIQRSSIASYIVHHWPDEIGKPLDPTDGQAMPNWLIPEPQDEIADLERKIRDALPTLKVRRDSKPGAEVHNMILADARALMAGEPVDISNSRLEALRVVASGIETMQRLQASESAPKKG